MVLPDRPGAALLAAAEGASVAFSAWHPTIVIVRDADATHINDALDRLCANLTRRCRRLPSPGCWAVAVHVPDPRHGRDHHYHGLRPSCARCSFTARVRPAVTGAYGILVRTIIHANARTRPSRRRSDPTKGLRVNRSLRAFDTRGAGLAWVSEWIS